jgi:broad specificity phosphatase PhoE
MVFPQKKIYLIRHGETEWTLSGRHTGTTDISLTKNGESDAAMIGKALRGHAFKTILCSPLKRSRETCEIAGFFKQAQIEEDLAEWNYGKYEGLTTQEIWKASPHWNIFTNGAPQGESPTDVTVRIHRLLAKIQSIHGDIALFSHGHFLRALAAHWLHLSTHEGRLFALSPGSISILGYERANPVLSLWNDVAHIQPI